MSTYQIHKSLYLQFKRDAQNKENFEGTRVEAFFLAAYHLIEACAAKFNVHINKHQQLRKLLENNSKIFGPDTENVWLTFQNIENRLRPKFLYGQSWNNDDFEEIETLFHEIETLSQKVIRIDSE